MLIEEKIADKDSCQDTRKVGYQSAGHSIARFGDAYAAEIDGQDVEGGIGGTAHHAAHAAYKRVDSELLHRINHQSVGSAAAERFHQGRGQSAYKAGVDAHAAHDSSNAFNQQVHGSGGAEYSNAHQKGHQIRNDAYGCGKSFFGSFYKGVVYIDLFPYTCQDEQHNDAEQQDVGCQRGVGAHLFACEVKKQDHQCREKETHHPHQKQDGLVDEVDFLTDAHRDDTHQCRNEGTQQNRNEYVCGL